MEQHFFKPKESNAGKGFYFDVTDEEIRAHQQRSISDIFQWIESTNKFVSAIQTTEEKSNMALVRSSAI